MIPARVIFTARRWRRADGDPSEPPAVLGAQVTRRLCSRADGAGALVALGDGRYALTGSTVAVGGPSQLRRYIRRQTRRPLSAEERLWLEQVVEALDSARSALRGAVV